jgi:hypothetical protein
MLLHADKVSHFEMLTFTLNPILCFQVAAISYAKREKDSLETEFTDADTKCERSSKGRSTLGTDAVFAAKPKKRRFQDTVQIRTQYRPCD